MTPTSPGSLSFPCFSLFLDFIECFLRPWPSFVGIICRSKEIESLGVILVTHRSHGYLESFKIHVNKAGSEVKKEDVSFQLPPSKLSVIVRPPLKPPFLPCFSFVGTFKGPLCDLYVAQWWNLSSPGALLLFRMVVDVSAGGQPVMRLGTLGFKKSSPSKEFSRNCLPGRQKR
ncbi:hypothetical protein GQ457_08G026170 [Hibiscus cannabinus]